MRALFASMSWEILKLNGIFLIMAIGTAAVFNRLGWGDLAEPFGIFLLFTLFLGPIETSRKLPLMLSFPFSRNRLLLLTGFTNLIGSLISAACVFAYYGFALYFLKGMRPAGSLWEIFGGLFPALLEGGHSIFKKSIDDPRTFAGILTAPSLLALFFFLTINNQILQKKQQSVSSRKELKTQIKLLFTIYAAIGVFLVLAWNSSFLLMAFLMIGVNLGSAGIVSEHWVFSPSRKRKWLMVFGALGIAQSLVLFSFCVSSVRSGNAKLRIQSADFLGIVGPEPGPDFIRTVVAEPIDQDVARKLIELVGPKDTQWDYLPYQWKARAAPLHYREMIANQNNASALQFLVSLYNPKSLTEDDLLFLTNKKIDAANGIAPIDGVPGQFQWLAVSLSDDLIWNFLRDKSDANVKLALKYIEFHPSEKFIEPLAQRLRSDLSGALIPVGIRTLSVLLGEKLDLRSYLSQVAIDGKRSFYKINCAEKHLPDLLGMKEGNDAPIFNRCIRELAVSHGRPIAISKIDQWYSLPLSKNDRKALDRAFIEN